MRTNKLCEMFLPIRPSLCTTQVTEEGRLAIYGFMMLLDGPHRTENNNAAFSHCDDSDQPGRTPRLNRFIAMRSLGSQWPKHSSCRRRRR